MLKRARERTLACYEGNAAIEMVINIKRQDPLTLTVHIKNVSPRPRHANINFLTLVTKSGRSLSYWSRVHSEYSESAFGAVDLQPGTETSGVVMFNTSDAPKRLIYKELIGTSIGRDFP